MSNVTRCCGDRCARERRILVAVLLYLGRRKTGRSPQAECKIDSFSFCWRRSEVNERKTMHRGRRANGWTDGRTTIEPNSRRNTRLLRRLLIRRALDTSSGRQGDPAVTHSRLIALTEKESSSTISGCVSYPSSKPDTNPFSETLSLSLSLKKRAT